MKYKNIIASILSIGAIGSLSAAELFQTESLSTAAPNIVNASQAEVEQLRSTNMSIREAHIYNLNAQALSEQTNKLTLNLTPHLKLNVKKISATFSSSGSLIWQGKSSSNSVSSEDNSLNQSIILVLRNGKVTGTVRTDGRLFKIQPLKSGQHLVLEIDENNMKPDHPPGVMQQLEAESQNQPLIAAPSINVEQMAANPVIKLLVVYSNGVPAEVSDIQAMTDLAIAETNQGYVNSSINATVELAHFQAISYNEVGISTDLNRLKGTSDGYMDSVHSLRDQYAADVVMLLVPSNGGACGQAAAIGASQSTAFAVTAQDCATGYYSFGHEIGHLQSARHNPETDGTTTPYAFGHGYRDPQSQWRTVMAYNCSSGCSRINWWSNPNKTRNGTPMGTTSKSDNARVLNLTAATVAGFRSGTTPPAGNELENGITKGSLGASSGNSLNYTFEVPAGASNISFVMSGGSGDADLYVKFGSAPTDSSYDCRPYKNGNSETCTGTQTGGTYYVRLKAYSTFSGTSITASYDGGGTPPGPTPINQTISNISVSQGSWARYTQNLTAGYATLTVSISGGSGDADLYVRSGSAPTTSSYNCRPYKNGNNETCTFSAPAAGDWHIGIRGYSSASGVTLSIQATP